MSNCQISTETHTAYSKQVAVGLVELMFQPNFEGGENGKWKMEKLKKIPSSFIIPFQNLIDNTPSRWCSMATFVPGQSLRDSDPASSDPGSVSPSAGILRHYE